MHRFADAVVTLNKERDSPSKHQTVHNDVLKGRFTKQECGEHQQRVEPTAGYKESESVYGL